VTHSPQSLATFTLRLRDTLLCGAATHRREGRCARRRARDPRLRARETQDPRRRWPLGRRSTGHDSLHTAHEDSQRGRHTGTAPCATHGTTRNSSAPQGSAPNSVASVRLKARAVPAVTRWSVGAVKRHCLASSFLRFFAGSVSRPWTGGGQGRQMKAIRTTISTIQDRRSMKLFWNHIGRPVSRPQSARGSSQPVHLGLRTPPLPGRENHGDVTASCDRVSDAVKMYLRREPGLSASKIA
jgi:hypothetical protein